VPDFVALDWGGAVQSLYEELTRRYGLVPQRGETVLSARLADSEEALLLDIEPPGAVLVVEQIAYDAVARPINLTLAIQHPARYPLRLEQGSADASK